MQGRLARRLLPAVLGVLGARAAAQTPPPAPVPSTSLSGVAYAQFLYQLRDAANHANNFDITRAYLNVTGRFSGGVATRVTADIYRQAGGGDGSLRYRLKYAYVGYTPANSPLTFKFGQMQTPWIDFEETLWDYRMQGTVALDRAGYLSSSDFGVGVDGKWGPDRVNLQFALINGENYNGGTGDQRKDLTGRVSVRVRDTDDSSRVGGLRLTAYAQIGKPTSGGTRNRFVGMASFRTRRLTIAALYGTTTDTVTATPTPETDGRVISAFGVYRVPNSKVAVLGRLDSVDPDTNVGGDRLTRAIAGVSYQLSPNLRLLADLDHLSYQGTPTPAQEAVRSQALVQAQFTF